MTKEYIENLYRNAVMDFKFAHSEDEQWEARHDMANLERFAIEQFGYVYVETVLEELKKDLIS